MIEILGKLVLAAMGAIVIATAAIILAGIAYPSLLEIITH